MALDIRGSLKNTKISSNKYVVIEELLSNSIDSFLIRRSQDSSIDFLRVIVRIELIAADLLSDQLDLSISCSDNGCGLGDEQTNAFLTKDTSYKDDLSIAGIGQCKGSGRIQFFHHFSRVGLQSTYRSEGRVFTRTLNAIEGRKQIDLKDFIVTDGNVAEIGTIITLENLKSSPRERFYKSESLRQVFSATNVRLHMLVAFLQRLVSLQAELGEFEIKFLVVSPSKNVEIASLRASDLPQVSDVRFVKVEESDPLTGAGLSKFQTFKILHYKLDAETYDIPRNAISLCAKSSPVKDITGRYLRSRAEQNSPVGGYHHIVLIESDLLDGHVNEQRDGFDNIPEEIPANDMFSAATISYEAIYEGIDPIVDELVAPIGWSKEEIIKSAEDKFGVSPQMLADTDTRVRHGDTAKSVAERVLKKYQDRIIADTADIFDLKEEIIRSEPHTIDFRKKIHEISWKYTSSIKSFDMANLSQLIVRRAAIVEILSLACRKELNSQAVGGDRRKDERIIHSIFFPMGADSQDVSDHDIWLLGEEYQYYDYIASDKALSQISWKDDTKLFENDVDEELAEAFQRRADKGGRMRPDIAIFDKEGSAIIIEFKAPGVSVDDHIGDLSEYAQLLAAKSNGRLRKFYGYLVGDSINRLRMAGWTKFPTGKGYFQSSRLQDPDNDRVIGELYAEVLFYDDVVDRAKKRIGVYQDRLKINISR